jgi:hypothetical protein
MRYPPPLAHALSCFLASQDTVYSKGLRFRNVAIGTRIRYLAMPAHYVLTSEGFDIKYGYYVNDKTDIRDIAEFLER